MATGPQPTQQRITSFTVRVYPGGGPALVVPGGDDLGTYIEPRAAFRLYIPRDQLRPLPPGSDADFELPTPGTGSLSIPACNAD